MTPSMPMRMSVFCATQNAVEAFDHWNSHWNPELQVMNAFTGVRESIVYNLVYDADGRATVQEQRLLRGSFSESLELGDYPFDVQVGTVGLLVHQNLSFHLPFVVSFI